MDDDRGNLALEFLRLAQRKTPQWLVWENVPGVLSSNGGRDFGSFLGALAEIGYGFAYRVLDAQYFGVAQRRRRVFVVGYLGDWRRAAAVLFEREGLLGNPAPSREEGEKVDPAVTTGPPFSRTGNERVECEAIVPCTRLDLPEHDVCGTLSDGAHMGGGLNGQDAYSGRVMAVGFQSTANACDAAAAGENVSPTLRRDPMAVAMVNMQGSKGNAVAQADGPSYTLNAMHGHDVHAISQGLSVRRLTPTECERLQGFPDGFTQIPWRNKPAENCPDGPRYKALGNSMAVPVMSWIGRRIQAVEAI